MHPAVLLRTVHSSSPPAWDYDNDERPPLELDDLCAPLPDSCSRRVFAPVCVPFYTEGGPSLRRTLEALALQQEDLQTAAQESGQPPPLLHVFAIGDGWRQPSGERILSLSMLAELEDLFGDTFDASAVDAIFGQQVGTGEHSHSRHSAQAILVQLLTPSKELAPVFIDCTRGRAMRARAGSTAGDSETIPIFVSVLLKRHNCKKHHSHSWFFEAFAPLTRLRAISCSGGSIAKQVCPYYFATDCGTLYAPRMLAELAEHMERHPRAGAATGHQRVMHADDQAESGTLIGAAAAHLRRVQCVDVESQLCLFNGAHALAGFLPVIPGPCGFFRASALTYRLMCTVRATFASSADADGLVLGNLKLAEDRVLSYLLLLPQPTVAGAGDYAPQERAAGGGWETHWVPSTAFFFESEATLQELVLQRRRWINGSTAGLVWLVTNKSLLSALKPSRCNLLAWKIALLSIAELSIACVAFLLPAIFAFTGFVALGDAFIVAQAVGILQPVVKVFGVRSAETAIMAPLQAVFLLSAMISFIMHVHASRMSPARWLSRSGGELWDSRRLVGAFVMLGFIVTTLLLLALCLTAADTLRRQLGNWELRDLRLVTAFSLHLVLTPLYLSAAHSAESFRIVSLSFMTFFAYFPVLSADFFSFSVARLDDLTWGTKSFARPAHDESGREVRGDPLSRDLSEGRQLRHERRLASRRAVAATSPPPRCTCCSSIAGRWSSGAVQIISRFRDYRCSRRPDRSAHAAAATVARNAAGLYCIVNVCLVAWLVTHREWLQHRFVWTAGVFAGLPTILAFASLLYFVAHNCVSKSPACCCEALMAAASAAGWIASASCVVTLAVLSEASSKVDSSGHRVLQLFCALSIAFLAVQFGRIAVCSKLPSCPVRFTSRRMPWCRSRAAKTVPTKLGQPWSRCSALALFAMGTLMIAGFGIERRQLTLRSWLSVPGLHLDAPLSPLAADFAGARVLQYLHSRGEAARLRAPEPIRAVYIDVRDVNWNDPADTVTRAANASYNVIFLSFLVSQPPPAEEEGRGLLSDADAAAAMWRPSDMLAAWVGLTNNAIDTANRRNFAWSARHNASIAFAHERGAVVLLSVGGATDTSYFLHDPAAFGASAARFALQHNLDGVDFDLENIGPRCSLPGLPQPAGAVDWLVRATLAARTVLGPLPLLTHAPLAADFSRIDDDANAGGTAGSVRREQMWAGPTGCYSAVYRYTQSSPHPHPATRRIPLPAIDFFVVQLYNQGRGCHETFETLFLDSFAHGTAGIDCFSGTSIAEIASYGVPLSALVVGKPLLPHDAGTNYVSAGEIAAFFRRAETELGWRAGVMSWAWSRDHSPAWIKVIYPSLVA